ncbi:unnamed protein product [Ilex paraguariensis]|uniref:Uncharacterized protein n=1 Tax=Ilex paraguariensis TaxID=185542 RepID=A0ABC8TW30_9AQUA
MNSWVTLTASLVVLLSIASLPLLKNHYFLNWRPWWSSNSVVADLLVTNGTIYTSDDSLPFADSMAILNGRVLRVGNYSSLKVIIFNLLFILLFKLPIVMLSYRWLYIDVHIIGLKTKKFLLSNMTRARTTGID